MITGAFETFPQDDTGLVSFERGWPRVRRLVDGHPDDAKPAAAALAVIVAIDPVYGFEWPRGTAHRFLHAMTLSMRHTYKPTGATLHPNVRKALEKTSIPGIPELRTFLESHVPSMELYAFHATDALFLFECLLGTATVANEVVARLEKLSSQEFRTDNPNDVMFDLAWSLGFLLLRLSAAEKATMVKRITALIAARPEEALLTSRLSLIVGGAPALRAHIDDPKIRLEYEFPTQKERRAHMLELVHRHLDFCDDSSLIAEIAAAGPSWWLDPRAVWLGGPSLLPGFEKRLRGAPTWMLDTLVEELGPIRHAGIVELMAHLAAARGSRRAAIAWCVAHLDFAGPHLETLAKGTGKAAEGAKLALAAAKPEVSRGKGKAAPPAAKPVDLQTELAQIAKTFVKEMQQARGNEKKEREVIAAGIESYVEARTAAGVAIPSAYAGHFFSVDGSAGVAPPFDTLKATKKERDRWGDLLEDELDGYG